jgi:hypothetical protein
LICPTKAKVEYGKCDVAEENDLKPLSRLAEFKKLLPPPAPAESPTVKNP